MLASVSLFTYSLKGSHFFKRREGFILQKGPSCFAEVAPLPSWSRESLHEALKQLILLSQGLPPERLYPSVQFALECLKHPIPSGISAPICALLAGTISEIYQQADAAQARGITTAKLKLTHLTKQNAHQLIRSLKKRFRLRVDCNQCWSLKEALTFFQPFEPVDFDYIEEPLQNPIELHDFPYPIALDETLRSDFNWSELSNVKALILKPTLHERFKAPQNVPVVLSSAFESSVGLSHLIRLSHEHGHLFAQGLGTFSFFTEDLLHTPLTVEDGRIMIPASWRINASKLTKIHELRLPLPH